MIIAIGADHRGYDCKEYLMKSMPTISWLDVGAYSNERSDYPIYAQAVCQSMLQGKAAYGILLCGTGVGMSVVANRYPSIYAALVWNSEIARLSKEDDNANVLVLPADYVTDQEAQTIIEAWLRATFKEGRYRERLNLIDRISNDREE